MRRIVMGLDHHFRTTPLKLLEREATIYNSLIFAWNLRLVTHWVPNMAPRCA